MTAIKEHGYNISASVVVSWVTIGAFAWFFAEPILVASVSKALAKDVNFAVSQQVEPINNAFLALLQRDINATRKEIAALKFRQRRNQDWTAEDAAYLADKEIELSALLEAKAALEDT